MKKTAIYLFFLVAIAAIVFLVLNGQQNSQNIEPKRKPGIPENATWAGGIDGGNWYFISKVLSSNSFRIKIYNENSSEIESDTLFILNADCGLKEIDSLTLLKSINGYDGERIILTISDNYKHCFLSPK